MSIIERWMIASVLLAVLGASGLIVPTFAGWQLPSGWYTMSALMAFVGVPGVFYAFAPRP